jgi:two-component system, NtrC family, sensor histidine kinase HupT/HoxJ
MMHTGKSDAPGSDGLIARAGCAEALTLSKPDEDAWIEVIQKMDEVYAELVQHQVELERKNAALEETQQFIASVLASMTDVLIVCDRWGRIQRVNRALEQLTGCSEAEILGQPLADIFMPHSLPVLKHMLEKTRDDNGLADCEVALIDANGAPAPLAMNCSAGFDHKGRYIGSVMAGRPLGELRRAYKKLDAAHHELREAQQQLVFSEKMAALGRLVAGVAHELNNPISFVFANMHALKRYGLRLREYLNAVDSDKPNDELKALRRTLRIDRILLDIEPLVDGTLEGATRVSEIVQDLRRFSSSQTAEAEPFDLARVVRTAAEWVAKAARTKPSLAFDLQEPLDVISKRGLVHQVMVNLAQNAVDAMEGHPAPVIEISAEAAADSVTVRVRDHGPGISPSAMQKLFEPFFTTKPIGKGLGLGLYVSYGLAKELGGALTAANHPRGGAVFSLSFPVRRAGDAA